MVFFLACQGTPAILGEGFDPRLQSPESPAGNASDSNGRPVGENTGGSGGGGMNADPNDPGMNPVPIEVCDATFEDCLSSGREGGQCEDERAACLMGVPVDEGMGGSGGGGMNADPSDPGMNPVPTEVCDVMFEDCMNSGREGGQCEDERAACLMGVPVGESTDPADELPVPVVCEQLLEECLGAGVEPPVCEMTWSACLAGAGG